MGTTVMADSEYGTFVENDTDIPTPSVLLALSEQHPEMAALVRWTADVQGRGTFRRAGNLFDRDRYVTPKNIHEQMKMAYRASETDDVVSNVLESTESLAFSKMSFWCEDEDEEDVWNQIAADIDLDSRLREMWRELFTVSQFYVGVMWGKKSYKVRGKSEKGIRRKKEFNNLQVPVGVTILDPLKIAPVGMTMFEKEKLVWIADRDEAEELKGALADGGDRIISSLVSRPYEMGQEEKRRLDDAGFPTGEYFLLNPNNVFRHTATKPGYLHFASVRMTSVFELLDLKSQLRAMDRAHLLGGTNWILLVKKGTDERPAKPEEIANLQMQVKTVARLPVLVGDHRLSVEIVTPKLDNTLRPERYNTVDSRITARLYQMYLLGNYAAGAASDKSSDLMKVVARGMESRRQMIKRTLEKNLFNRVFDNNEQFTEKPQLRFHPKQIALDFDQAFASFLLELRMAKELSRETILSQFDLDQDDEHRFRLREKDKYDDDFGTTVPFSAPANNADPGTQQQLNKSAGRAGGRQGGAAPGTGQGQAPRSPRKKSDNDRPVAANEEEQ